MDSHNVIVTMYKTLLLHNTTHSPLNTLDTSLLIRTFFFICRPQRSFSLLMCFVIPICFDCKKLKEGTFLNYDYARLT